MSATLNSQLPFNLELANPKLDLVEVDPKQIIPGACFLVQWIAKHGQGLSSWIGVICDDTILPDNFIAAKIWDDEVHAAGSEPEVSNRDKKHPVWLMGKKAEFRWIHAFQIYMLNDSICDAFKLSPDFNHFSACYYAAMGKLGYMYWKSQIVQARTEELITETGEADESSVMEEARKRKRVQNDDDELSGFLDRASGSSNTFSIGSGSTNHGEFKRIKKETLDDAAASTNDPLIAVYVGDRNTKFMIRKTALIQSDYLTSLVTLHPPNPQSFIMNPEFGALDIRDFSHILTYLESGKFTTKPELHLCARVYCLAHRFDLDGLKKLVYQKITGSGKVVAKEMLTIIGYIFKQISGEDMLKVWLLDWHVENYCLLINTDSLAVTRMWGANKDLEIQVAVARAEALKKWGVRDVIKIEESDG